MKKFRIYVDTSVIGGCCDPEFQEWSWQLLADFKDNKLIPLLSRLTDLELLNAQPEVKNYYREFTRLTSEIEILTLIPEVLTLADAYIKHKILTQNYYNDA